MADSLIGWLVRTRTPFQAGSIGVLMASLNHRGSWKTLTGFLFQAGGRTKGYDGPSPKGPLCGFGDPGISRDSTVRGTMGTHIVADTPSNDGAQSKQRARRFLIQTRLRYRVKRERTWREGKTENMSRSGLLFRGEFVIKPTTQIEISMVLPSGILGDGAAEVVCRGTVVRTVPPASAGSMPGLATTISHYRLVRS
jgi:PilZ domain